MAIDPRALRPSELCRLLNSTPLGEVISERQLLRHRTRAGLRIGEGQTVNLVRYVAWLVALRHEPRPEPEEDPYEKVKQRARARNMALALAGRDIGELPEVVEPNRKARAATDFQLFCESYFPQTFHLAWSRDHLKVISKIERAVLHGGLFAMAMPRGSGKTTICECACIWASLYGHREFVCLIGSDEGHAIDMLDSIKTELEGNDLLLEDFPEVVFPIQALDGIANRCNGQLYQGERTHIGWTAKEVVLPTIPDSPANFTGAIVDYGTYPDQKRPYFTLRDARVTMQHKQPGVGKEAAILAGIKVTIGALAAREYWAEDGQLLRVRRLLVDAGYPPLFVRRAYFSRTCKG